LRRAVDVADKSEGLVAAGRDDGRVVELVAAQDRALGPERAIGSEAGLTIAERHPAFGEAGRNVVRIPRLRAGASILAGPVLSIGNITRWRIAQESPAVKKIFLIAAALLGFVVSAFAPAFAEDQGPNAGTDLYDRPVLAIDPGVHTAKIWAQAVNAAGRFAVTGSTIAQ
jgi:hypothetical protein